MATSVVGFTLHINISCHGIYLSNFIESKVHVYYCMLTHSWILQNKNYTFNWEYFHCTT